MTDGHPRTAADLIAEVAHLRRRADRERVARKEAEQLLEAKSRELWEQQERYRTLVENSSDVVATADMAGVLTWVSESVTSLLGWTPGQLVGKAVSDLVLPDDVAIYESQQERRQLGQDLRYEVRMRARDGTWPWVSVQSRQIIDEKGALSHRVAGWRDVTAEHRAQEQLRDAQMLLRTNVDAVLDPLVLCQSVRDDRGRIVDFTYLDVNEATCQYLSLTREDLIGTGTLSGASGVGDADLVAAYARAIETGEPVRFDGFRSYDEFLNLEAYFDIRGRAVPGDRLSLTWRNVTDREQAAARLAESEDRLRATLDAMLDPHVVLQAVRDTTGSIVDFVFADANASAAEFNGLSREDLIGVPLLGQHPAAGTTTLFDDYVSVVETGEPLIRDNWSYPQDLMGGELRRYDVRAVKFRDGLSQTWRDVTERYDASQRVAAAEEQYRLLADNSADIVVRLRDNTIVWMSNSVTASLGGDPDEWVGVQLADILHPEDMPTYEAVLAAVETGQTIVQRGRLRAHDGGYHWLEVHAKVFLDAAGHPDGLVASMRIVDAEVAAERELERLARFDTLTGAMNRAAALTRLAAATAQPRRPGSENGVLFCDVDRFNDINDTLGHTAGDAVLSALARRITACLSSEDIVARMGGDEFLVFLPGIHDISEAATIAERIRVAAVEPIPLGDDRGATHASLSIGVTLVLPGEDTDAFIERADTAMYAAKTSGRNKVTLIQ